MANAAQGASTAQAKCNKPAGHARKQAVTARTCPAATCSRLPKSMKSTSYLGAVCGTEQDASKL